jgi:trk system potassium uptake protein TrkH
MSAFTATGATALSGLDTLPLSVNVWRCFMMFVGGLGIIVLAVAILPLLGVGGSQLFKAETAGPMKDQKLTPRIADTARGIWVAYGHPVGELPAGLPLGRHELGRRLHAHVQHGEPGRLLVLRRESSGHWDSPLIEGVAIVFMLLSGVNLLLYYAVWRRRSLAVLWRNIEVRLFYGVLAGSIVLITSYLVATG